MLSYVRPYSLQARLMKPEHQRVRTVLGGEDTGYPEEMAAFLAATAKGSRDLDSAIRGGAIWRSRSVSRPGRWKWTSGADTGSASMRSAQDRTSSLNANTGSISTGISCVAASAFTSSAGILSYLANQASARARSPVASITSSSWASAASTAGHAGIIDGVTAAGIT